MSAEDSAIEGQGSDLTTIADIPSTSEALRACVEYLQQTGQAIIVRGASSKYLEEMQTAGIDSSKGTGGYSYWVVISPTFTPSLLESGSDDTNIQSAIGHALGHGDLLVAMIIPVSDLTRNELQSTLPGENLRADLRYSGWEPGAGSVNYGKGNSGFPAYRTNDTIPASKLHIYQPQKDEFSWETFARITQEILAIR